MASRTSRLAGGRTGNGPGAHGPADDADTPPGSPVARKLTALEAECAALRVALQDADRNQRKLEQIGHEWVTALDALQDPVFIHDGELRVVRANLAYARHAGVDIRDVIGRPYWEMFPRLAGPLPSCARAREHRQSIQELVTLDTGEEFVSRAHPIYDTAGNFLYSIHLLHDVTAQRRAEAENRVLGAALRQAAEAVVVLDADLQCTYANPAFARLFGYERDSMVGRSIAVLGVPGQRDDLQPELVARRIGTSGSWQGEVERLARDGTAVPVLMSGAMIRDASGATAGYVATYLDLRPLRDAERALRASEQRYRALTENTSDVITLLDGDGTQRYVSPSVTRALGHEPEALIGRSIVDFLHPQDVPATLGALNAAIADPGAVHRAEFRIRARDGEYRHFEAVGRSLLGDPAVEGVVINSRDITERKQNEESLRRVNRSLIVLSACNTTLIHATSEQELLDDICRLVVELGGYRMAWVGRIGDGGSSAPVPDAVAGIDRPSLENYCRLMPETADHPAVRVAAEGRTIVIHDAESPTLSPAHRDFLRRHDIAASIHLPLLENGKPVALLNIHATGHDAFDDNEVRLLEEMASDLAYGLRSLRAHAQRDDAIAKHQLSLEQLRDNMEDTIAAIAATLEMRDPYTAGHERRVAALAAAIAREMGFDEERIQGIHFGALIHDVGKIGVPAEILSKPRRLTAVEFELIKVHARSGYDILKGIRFPWPVATMVLQHHERLDGSGYPNGARGDEIILESRILAVADVVEAMSSHRPYRPAVGLELALEHLRATRGQLFDPDVVDACLRLLNSGTFDFPSSG